MALWRTAGLPNLARTLDSCDRDDFDTSLGGGAPGWQQILLNLTTLYGFILPTGYINTGAWSIGNEMVYYSLTPIIVVAYNRSVGFGNLLLLLALAVGAGFAFSWLNPTATLAAQWALYVNPFNNLFLFVFGISLYYNTAGQRWSRGRALAAMVVALATFGLYPVSGDQILIVTGLNRFVFSAAAVLLVLSFYKLELDLPRALATPLTQLGLATYGVYLLHPLVRLVCHRALPDAGVFVLIPLTIALTLLVSLVVYHRIELPIMQIGKRLTRPQPQPAHAI